VLFGLKIVSCSQEETFGILILRLRMEKVNIKDNNHHHKVQQDFFTSQLRVKREAGWS